jgi:hypothetical protein
MRVMPSDAMTQSMRFIVLFILALFVIAPPVAVLVHPIQAQDSGTAAPSASQTVKGQLMMLAGEVAVIKDSTGKTIHLSISKATKVEGRLKDGDMVEVSMSSDGQAVSIRPSQ